LDVGKRRVKTIKPRKASSALRFLRCCEPSGFIFVEDLRKSLDHLRICRSNTSRCDDERTSIRLIMGRVSSSLKNPKQTSRRKLKSRPIHAMKMAAVLLTYARLTDGLVSWAQQHFENRSSDNTCCHPRKEHNSVKARRGSFDLPRESRVEALKR
jgi:hypothetical protein